MHVIRERNSGSVLFIDYGASEAPLKGESLLAGFDPTTMEIGWTSARAIPGYFDIDSSGHVVELSLGEATKRGLHRLEPHEKLVNGDLVPKTEEELAAEGQLDLDAIKADLTRACTQLALESRSKLLPDYKLQNAAIGVYPEEQIASFRATIDAFRAEVHRLEELIQGATTLADLRKLAPRFPEQLLPGKA